MKIHIPGPPVGKARARVTRRGFAFTPAKTRNAEAFIRALFVQKYPGQAPLEGPVEMMVLAYFAIPRSAPKKKQADMAMGVIRPTKKPDADNLLKLCADALNGLGFRDDSQIVEVSVEKWYSKSPHTEIIVNKLGEEEE